MSSVVDAFDQMQAARARADKLSAELKRGFMRGDVTSPVLRRLGELESELKNIKLIVALDPDLEEFFNAETRPLTGELLLLIQVIRLLRVQQGMQLKVEQTPAEAPSVVAVPPLPPGSTVQSTTTTTTTTPAPGT